MSEIPKPIASFIEHLPDRRVALKDALDKEDWVIVQRLAHQLKAAVLFGFPELGQAAGELEKSIKKEDVKSAKKEFQAVDKIAEEIVSGKRKFVDEGDL